MHTSLLQHRPPRRERGVPHLVVCSICLRVRRGSKWIEAERVIGRIRSYELAEPPRLKPAVCDVCAGSLLARRASAHEHLAA
jgi:hypothetical protein